MHQIRSNQLPIQDIHRLGKLILENQNFYILCHIRPDPDMVGGALSMYQILKMLGKNTNIYNIETENESMNFLKESDKMHPLNELTPSDFQRDSVVIFLDTGDPYEKYYPNWKNIFESKKIKTLNIDHHSDNERYADLNITDNYSSAVCELLTEIYKSWNILWTPEIATNLLAGILADTGNMMHDNTTPRTYKTVSFLIEKGADLELCNKNLFRSTTLGKIHLWGRVLKRIKWSSSDAVFSYVSQKDLKETGTNDEDLTGDIINSYMAGVKNSKYAIFIKEKEPNTIKVSLRTIRDDVNVQAIAKKFDGGGHVKASGFTLKNITIEKSIPLLKEKL